MGMDLEPINPSADAPRYPNSVDVAPGSIIWGRYNWGGWRYIIQHLESWGVDVSDFAGTNDGDIIPESKCKEVADAIEKHLPELSQTDQEWLQPHIALWRTCGGYRQF